MRLLKFSRNHRAIVIAVIMLFSLTACCYAKAHAYGKIHLNASYFGSVRKGKRGRGAAGEIPILAY